MLHLARSCIQGRRVVQEPLRQAHVLSDTLKPARTPHVPRPILGQCDASEGAASGEGRLGRIGATRFDLPLLQLAVKLQFLGQIGFELALPDRVPRPAKELSHGVLYVALRTL